MNTRLNLQSGFTIVELLVTISVTIIMMGLIGRIFNDATQSVSIGTQKSELITNAEVISDQLRADMKAIAGPNSSGGEYGFLIIVNREISTGALMPDMDNPTVRWPIDDPDHSETLRIDQLYFIRHSSELPALSPTNRNLLTPLQQPGAPFARVFYGHVDRTDRQGRTDGTILDPDNLGSNQNAWQWLLGRQALLLTPSPSGGNMDGVSPTSDMGGSNFPDGHDGNSAAGNELYRGIHDVSEWVLYSDDGETSGGSDEHAIIRGSAGPGGDYLVLNGTTSTNDDAYETAMLGDDGITFTETHLQGNTVPDPALEYQSWQIAQMHPILMEGVSDFEVAFAGDYDGNPGIDRTSGTTGNIEWYQIGNLPPSVGIIDPDISTADIPGRAFIFRHDDPSDWPYMIRVRFRLHDVRGQYKNYSELEGREILGQWFEVILMVNRDP